MDKIIHYHADWFYFRWFKASLPGKSFLYKDKFIRKLLHNDYVYKFVKLTDDCNLNKQKMECLFNSQLWFSRYDCFSDESEFSFKYSPECISTATGINQEEIANAVEKIKQIYVCCLTRAITHRMWKDYANYGQGLCLKFSVFNTDYIYPVLYTCCKHDFTNDIIRDLHNFRKNDSPKHALKRLSKASTLFAVEKDLIKYGWEDEIRLLSQEELDKVCCSGIPLAYENVGLKLESIIIGKNCHEPYKQQLLSFVSKNCIPIDTDKKDKGTA